VMLELADRRPVVLGIDDVQHTDSLSLLWLLHLTNRLHSSRLLVVLTERTDAQPSGTPLHTELLRQPHCRRISLDALSLPGVQILLETRLDDEVAAELAPACAMLSGGNPLLVRAVLEDYLTISARTIHGVEPPRLTPGEAFGHTVLACLHRCGPEVERIASGIAVLGDLSSPELLGALVEVGTEAAEHAMQTLNAIGLLHLDRFRHPVARAAVLNHLSPGYRGELQRRAARLLHDEGVAATTVAEHLVAAGGNPGEWAVSVLRETAVQAISSDQASLAMDCLDLACRICSDSRQRAELTIMLAGAQFRANPSVPTRFVARLTTALREGDLRGSHAVAAIEYLLWYGKTSEAEQALHQLLSTPEAAESETVSALRAFRLWVSSSYPWLLTRMPRQGTAAAIDLPMSAVTAGNDQLLHAASALTTVLSLGPLQAAVTAADQVLQSSQLGHATLDTVGTALSALVYADRLDIAGPWCDRLLAEASTRADAIGEALFATISAETALRKGDLPMAETHARRALTLVPPESWGVAVGSLLATLVLATTGMGKYDEAEWALGQRVPDATFRTRFGVQYRYARGHYYLAVGSLRAALSDFQGCGEQLIEWGIDQPGLVPWRVDAAWALFGLGKVERARKLADEQLLRQGTGASRTRGMALRVLAATSGVKDRPRLLRQAMEVLHACGARLELAKTLGDLGSANYTMREPDRARLLTRRAWQLARSCEAEPLCHALMPNRPTTIKAATDRGGDDQDAIVSLSDAERRVAGLAAQGLTNREIARRLYVTVSTVEQHLTRAYRKLKVNRRTDLPGGLLMNVADTA